MYFFNRSFAGVACLLNYAVKASWSGVCCWIRYEEFYGFHNMNLAGQELAADIID